VQYTGAGHPSLVHVNSSSGTCVAHESQNPPLGVLPDLPFANADIQLQKGDLLVILTDGLTEVENKTGEMFGEERIQQFVRERAAKPLAEIRQELLAAVDAFGKQEDDQTIVLIRAK
jgi:sigma-B regulation protein RsbU (phosphoserine phosphatase)